MAWSEPDAEPGALIARIESTSALFRAPLQLGDRAVLLTPSFGLCTGEGRSSRQLAAQATLAARYSQESGRVWSIHSAKSSDEAQRALTLLADIEGAIASGDIRIAYQPKWSIADNQLCGAEALVRWHHPTLGPIAPDNFIPLLENSGNMARLTLAYLKAFPADEVKIDKSFVTNMPGTVSDQILVRSTIELANELNFKVVAEGVEDADCLSKLAEYGRYIAQGLHIGRPDARAAH